MLRIPLILSVWSLAAFPAVAEAQIARDSSPQSALSHSNAPSSSVTTAASPEAGDSLACEADTRDAEDPSFVWRLRAYRHLDCVMRLVEEAILRAPDDGGETGDTRQDIRLSRKELEDIRRLAFWARDAAARIGR
jgi:hypothetical protein